MANRVRVPVPVAFRFGYEGGRFDGYASQPGDAGRSVEGALQQALVEVGAIEGPTRARFRSGSRTDRGVSARENVVAFRTAVPPERLPGALLGRVEGLWPLAAAAVPPGFDPRRAARREYRYFLAVEETGDTGPAGLETALAAFRGRHDFAAFSRLEAHRDPVRVVHDIEVRPGPPGLLVVRISGASFLWQQVRRMIAAGLAACRGETTARGIAGILARGRAGIEEAGLFGVAPPERLLLWRVQDPRVRFTVPALHRVRCETRRLESWAGAAAQAALLAGLLAEAEEEAAGD